MKSNHVPKMHSWTISPLLLLVHLPQRLILSPASSASVSIRPNMAETQLMNLSVTVPVISRDWLAGSPFLLLRENILALLESSVHLLFNRLRPGLHNIGRVAGHPPMWLRTTSQRR